MEEEKQKDAVDAIRAENEAEYPTGVSLGLIIVGLMLSMFLVCNTLMPFFITILGNTTGMIILYSATLLY